MPAQGAYVGLAAPGDVGSWQRECKVINATIFGLVDNALRYPCGWDQKFQFLQIGVQISDVLSLLRGTNSGQEQTKQGILPSRVYVQATIICMHRSLVS